MGINILAIAAMDEGRVIGFDNKIPWHIPEDMRRFSELTSGHTVLMGRKTYDSLSSKYKPLPRRKNIVVTKHPPIEAGEGVEVWDSVTECLDAYVSGKMTMASDKLWIIGGEQIFRATIEYWNEVYLTLVFGRHEGDAFFPKFEDNFKLLSEEKHKTFSYRHYRRIHTRP